MLTDPRFIVAWRELRLSLRRVKRFAMGEGLCRRSTHGWLA